MEPNRTAVAGGVRAETLDDGAIRRFTLATPKANILDLEKIEALTHLFPPPVCYQVYVASRSCGERL
jgi:hypothetical protein